MAQIERKLAAIMVADIAGYSTLMERSESRTFERVRTLREDLINPVVARYGGRIIKTTGDGFLAEFSSGTAALLCGIEIQRLNHAREATNAEGERIHLRMGINLGDIIIDGDDVSGDGVNVAARLEPLAPNDGICISGAVRDQVRDDLDVAFEDIGEQRVKNLSRPVRAYRINLTNTRPPTPIVVHSRKLSTPLIAGIGVVLLLLAGTVSYWYLGNGSAPGLPIRASNVSDKGDFAGMRITSALVIGNSKYWNHSALDNVANDATAIATALRLQAIPVSLKLDLGELEFKKEVLDFQSGDGVRLLFYAGHGWNLQGKNYLFPIDAPKEEELLAGKDLNKLCAVQDIYENVRGKMLILLDTHGDPVSVPDNVVLALSGSPRHMTMDSYRLADGTLSRHSPYVESIVEMLSSKERNLPSAFLGLSQRVGKKTKGEQIPWVSATLVGAGSWASDQIER